MCDPCCQSACPPMCCPEPCEIICCPMPSSCCPKPPSCCPTPCCPPKRCKSRELVASKLLTKCECTMRNGLQLDCPRTECQGRPLCATKPIPICCPSKFNWRYANVTMGKPAFAAQKKSSACPKSNVCNPCVVDCGEPSCDPCCYTC